MLFVYCYLMFKSYLRHTILLFFTSIITLGAYSQSGFQFKKKSTKKQTVDFKLINNLIVVPLKINDKKLSFILDSGVGKTILFNITENDSIGLYSVEKVKLQGLGKGEPVEALLSKNNNVRLNRIENNNQEIYITLQNQFDLSSKMGTTIHGVIGFDLLKNFIIKINYSNSKLTFYNPEFYNLKDCRKCEILPIEFYRNKPYINTQVQLDTVGNKLTDVKLLIDTGGSDAMWLFEESKKEIQTPQLFFKDILGEGLSGTIYGNRSRIPSLVLNSFKIKNPTVSFLDTITTKNARNFRDRNGSIGGGVLQRFKVWLDYPNSKIMLRKTAAMNKKFNYNMSGLEVVYNGKKLVQEQKFTTFQSNMNDNVSKRNTINFISSFSFLFKPSYKIKTVLKGSPADLAGLKAGDVILKLNNKKAYEYKLSDINYKFQEKDKKKIKMLISRNGIEMKFEFRLQKKV